MEKNGLIDNLSKLYDAKEGYNRAKKMKCTCTGFVLQYEGGCQCERGKELAKYRKVLDYFIGV